jgi:hypothetical protein
MDLDFRNRSDALTPVGLGAEGNTMGNLGMGDARVNMDRFFGPDEEAFFRIQFRGRNAVQYNGDREWAYHYFYVKFPFAFDSFLTVGWTGDELIDKRFGFVPDMPGRYYTGGWFNDTRKPMIMLQKSFEMGNFMGWISHPNVYGSGAWEVMANFDFKWNEQFGFGLGLQYLAQDDWRFDNPIWDSAFTGWFGVDFNFVQGASLHGIFYFQSRGGDDPAWDDNGNAWRVAVDLSQDLLNFTSLYLEYGKVGEGFWAMEGIAHNVVVLGDRDPYGENSGVFYNNMSIAPEDISFYKIGAVQKWNDTVRTWLFYVNSNGDDFGLRQYGIGVDYVYNPYTIFSLNYMKWQGVDNWDDLDYGRIRFTTQISF